MRKLGILEGEFKDSRGPLKDDRVVSEAKRGILEGEFKDSRGPLKADREKSGFPSGPPYHSHFLHGLSGLTSHPPISSILGLNFLTVSNRFLQRSPGY